MAVTAEDLYEILRKLRMDLSDAQSKITSVFQVLNELNIQDQPSGSTCEFCGPLPFGPRKLAEHMHTSHGHPLPDDEVAA